MIAEISAGISSLKTAKELVQGLNSLKTEAALNEVKINLQSLILDAQQGLFAGQEAQSAAAERIRQLEQKLMEFENWTAESERYELADAGQGTMAYRLKPGMENGEPPHWLCATCFQDRKKSHLHKEDQFPGRNTVLRCMPCRTELIISGQRNTVRTDNRR
jgi:hypothetical protein